VLANLPAVLAPALCGAVLVEDERCVSATCPDPVLLNRAMADPLLLALWVETDAPVPAEDPVVVLDKLREGILGRGVEGLGGKRHRRVLPGVSALVFPAGGLDWRERR
jgi:hypothetical protein